MNYTEYLDHLARNREKAKRWRDNHPGITQAYMRVYVRTEAGRFRTLRLNAKHRGHEITLTRQQYAELNSQPCFYCGGVLPSAGTGLDRIDSGLGYIPGNCRPCCYTCNTAKNKLSEAEFKAWITKVYNTWVSPELGA